MSDRKVALVALAACFAGMSSYEIWTWSEGLPHYTYAAIPITVLFAVGFALLAGRGKDS